MSPIHLKIFISSPGDVNAERVITGQVIHRLAEEFENILELEPIFWEHEPMRMTDTFQTQIIPTSQTDIFICILWSRIGTRLPAKLTRPDGSRYESGTEYEFEDAWKGYVKTQKPDMLIYRKMAKPPFLLNPDAPDYAQRLAQKEKLDAFFRKWFQDEEGSFTSAFNPFEGLDDFEERVESHLRKVLESYLSADQLQRKGRSHTWRRGSPFRGLEVFEAEHAAVFFGRTRAISDIIAALRAQAQQGQGFVMVLGASGSGKSSLVRAGVLPLLTQEGVIEGVGLWRCVILRPSDMSDNLVQCVAWRLLSEQAIPLLQDDDAQVLENLLRCENHNQIHAFIAVRLALLASHAGFAPEQVRLVVVVDQMEEIFTQREFTPQARQLFVGILVRLARFSQVWVITTFRSDFYHRCAELPELVSMMSGRGQYLLTPPSPSSIGQMIRMPAKAAGLRFEQHPQTEIGLDEVLLDATVKNPESLALLEFTLEALYQQRNAHGMLSYQAYQEMGGLEGALARRAEEVFQRTSTAAQAAFPLLMRALVTTGQHQRAPLTSRRALYNPLAANAACNELMQAMLHDRLLVAGSQSGQATVSVAHEALLHHWPRLQDWVAQDRHHLQVRSRIAAAAEHWEIERHAQDLLLPEGKPLIDALDLLTDWEGMLETQEQAFIQASLEADQARRKSRELGALRKLRQSYIVMGGLGFLAFVALLGAGFGIWQAEEAKIERDKARYQEASLYAEQAQTYYQEGNSIEAMQRALKALQHTKSQNKHQQYIPAAEAALYNALLIQHQAHILYGHQDAVLSADFSPDGRFVVTGSNDHTARLWDRSQGQLQAVLQGHTNLVWKVLYSPNGRYIASASADNTARLWNGENGTLQHILSGHQSLVSDLDFSPDSQSLLTVSADHSARIWDTASGTERHILHGHTQNLTSGSFSPDGQYLVTTSNDHSARLWDAQTGQPLAVLSGHKGMVGHAMFSPDGRTLVTTSRDRTARLWEVPSGKSLHQLQGHVSGVSHAAFSPDGHWVITTSHDRVAIVWNVHTGKEKLWLMDRQAEVSYAEFSPDNRFIVSASTDHSALLRPWDEMPQNDQLHDSAWPWEMTSKYNHNSIFLHGHTGVVYVAHFSPDSQQVVTTSADHTARLWNVSLPHTGQRLTVHTQTVNEVVFSPDGNRLASVGADQIGVLYDLAKGQVMAKLEGHQGAVISVRFTPDGEKIFTAGEDGDIRVWNGHSGALEAVWHGHSNIINALDVSPDGQWLASGGDDKTVRLWNIATGKQQAILEGMLNGHQHSVTDVRFNHHSNALISASLEGARLWYFLDSLQTQSLSNEQQGVEQACFSPDDRLLLIVSQDKTARLWRVKDGALLQTFSGHWKSVSNALFSPDGRLVATFSFDHSAKLWNVQDGRLLQTLEGHQNGIRGGVFFPSSNRLVTVSADHSAQLWDVAHGASIGRLEGHEDVITAVALNPTGTWLATASADHTIRLWRVFPTTQDLLDYVHTVVPIPVKTQPG